MELIAEMHPGSQHIKSRGHVVDTQLGYSGDLIQLRNLSPVDTRSADGAFFKHAAKLPNRYEISRANEYGEFSTEVPETNENFTNVQELPGGRWLLVRARASGDDDLNAAILDVDGQCIKRLHLGDGIEDVQTTRDGSIWVSYFDEGVFGDTSLGRSGAVKLTDDGEVVLRLDQINSYDNFVDCYAMNVVQNDSAWLYYYTGFPLIEVRNRKIEKRYEDIGVSGARCFAVFRQWALFGGSYDNPLELSLVDLARRTKHAVGVRKFSNELLTPLQLFARGSVMCMVCDEFYIVDLMKCPKLSP
jgi:hypothetical protein